MVNAFFIRRKWLCVNTCADVSQAYTAEIGVKFGLEVRAEKSVTLYTEIAFVEMLDR